MTADNRAKFGASTWTFRLLRDERIPAGKALAVALAIAGQIRWSAWELQPGVRTLAERLDVTEEFCRDLIAYLVGLGYLVPSGTHKRRPIYVPALPDEFVHPIKATVPTNEDQTTDATITAA